MLERPGEFSDLSVHPDVPEGVRILRESGLRLVTLSNGSADVADRLLVKAGLRVCAVPASQIRSGERLQSGLRATAP